MCDKIIVDLGAKEIETAKEFIDHFGFEPETVFGYTYIIPEACLCQCDVEKAFEDNSIKFLREFDGQYGDFYVGKLEESAEYIKSLEV